MAKQTATPPTLDVESSVSTCSPATTSHKPVKDSFVKEALRLDKGDEVRLLSWTAEQVSQKGNNYISDVISVSVQYCRCSVTHEVTYIVKLQRKREDGIPSNFDNLTFSKEGQFFTKLLPLMNAELTGAGQRPLQIPRCYHSRWEEGQDQIFLQDLRREGFQVAERQRPLDERHTTLVLQELARLHAASYLLQKRTPQQDLTEKFKFLAWEWYNYTEQSRKDFLDLISGSLRVTSGLARVAGYKEASKWFEDLAPRAVAVLEEQIAADHTLAAVCHGDCCVHNLMFRYDDEGEPVEVMLLDLQICRWSSPATDLNYFLLTSLDEPERTAKLDDFLLTYHAAFKAVVEAGGAAMPFTPTEIKEEFHKKNVFGVVMASILIPLLVGENQEIPDFDSAMDSRVGEYVERLQQQYTNMLENNPLLLPRLANLFELMSTYGVMN